MIDPRAFKVTPRYELKLHEISPEDIEPLGDRYLVEVIDIDEKVELGHILVVTKELKQDDRDPMADPTIERRGVMPAVIVAKGNGHLLGLAGHAPEQGRDPHDRRHWASAPMFYDEGDVVLVDYSSRGRALKIVGRELRIVGQIDVLARVGSVRLRRTENGWEQE